MTHTIFHCNVETSTTFRDNYGESVCSLNFVVIVDRIKDTRAPFYRPEVPHEESEGVNPGILTLMKQCWAEEPPDRPSFDEIAKTLKSINKGK